MPDTIDNKKTNSGDAPPAVETQTANKVITAVGQTDNVDPVKNPSITTSFAKTPTKLTMTSNSPVNPYIKTSPPTSDSRSKEPPTVAAASYSQSFVCFRYIVVYSVCCPK